MLSRTTLSATPSPTEVKESTEKREFDAANNYLLSSFPTVGRYVNYAMFDPQVGYYAVGNVIFNKDFSTFASTSHPMSAIFVESIIETLYSEWQQKISHRLLALNEKFYLIECGAGDGALCYKILARLKQKFDILKYYNSPRYIEYKNFLDAFNYCVIEKSPELIKRQKQKNEANLDKILFIESDALKFQEVINFLNIKVIMVMSNELLDVLPVEEIVKNPKFNPQNLLIDVVARDEKTNHVSQSIAMDNFAVRSLVPYISVENFNKFFMDSSNLLDNFLEKKEKIITEEQTNLKKMLILQSLKQKSYSFKEILSKYSSTPVFGSYSHAPIQEREEKSLLPSLNLSPPLNSSDALLLSEQDYYKLHRSYRYYFNVVKKEILETIEKSGLNTDCINDFQKKAFSGEKYALKAAKTIPNIIQVRKNIANIIYNYFAPDFELFNFIDFYTDSIYSPKVQQLIQDHPSHFFSKTNKNFHRLPTLEMEEYLKNCNSVLMTKGKVLTFDYGTISPPINSRSFRIYGDEKVKNIFQATGLVDITQHVAFDIYISLAEKIGLENKFCGSQAHLSSNNNSPFQAEYERKCETLSFLACVFEKSTPSSSHSDVLSKEIIHPARFHIITNVLSLYLSMAYIIAEYEYEPAIAMTSSNAFLTRTSTRKEASTGFYKASQELCKIFLPVDEFINFAMFDPEIGYYPQGHVVFGKASTGGPGTHFSTLCSDKEAVTIFSWDILNSIYRQWKQMIEDGLLTPKEKIYLLELEAGEGSLCKNVFARAEEKFKKLQIENLAEFKDYEDFYKAFYYCIVDKSPACILRQKEKNVENLHKILFIQGDAVDFCAQINQCNINVFAIVSNELINVLPVHEITMALYRSATKKLLIDAVAKDSHNNVIEYNVLHQGTRSLIPYISIANFREFFISSANLLANCLGEGNEPLHDLAPEEELLIRLKKKSRHYLENLSKYSDLQIFEESSNAPVYLLGNKENTLNSLNSNNILKNNDIILSKEDYFKLYRAYRSYFNSVNLLISQVMKSAALAGGLSLLNNLNKKPRHELTSVEYLRAQEDIPTVIYNYVAPNSEVFGFVDFYTDISFSSEIHDIFIENWEFFENSTYILSEYNRHVMLGMNNYLKNCMSTLMPGGQVYTFDYGQSGMPQGSQKFRTFGPAFLKFVPSFSQKVGGENNIFKHIGLLDITTDVPFSIFNYSAKNVGFTAVFYGTQQEFSSKLAKFTQFKQPDYSDFYTSTYKACVLKKPADVSALPLPPASSVPREHKADEIKNYSRERFHLIANTFFFPLEKKSTELAKIVAEYEYERSGKSATISAPPINACNF